MKLNLESPRSTIWDAPSPQVVAESDEEDQLLKFLCLLSYRLAAERAAQLGSGLECLPSDPFWVAGILRSDVLLAYEDESQTSRSYTNIVARIRSWYLNSIHDNGVKPYVFRVSGNYIEAGRRGTHYYSR